MDTNFIILGRAEYPIDELPFKKLKKLLPVINRVARAMSVGRLDDADMDDLGSILIAATGLSMETLDEMPILMRELGPAFKAIVALAGLKPAGEVSSGEESAGALTGTNSTPT